MLNRMTALMEHSSEMVQDIRNRLDDQDALLQDMEQVFHQVSNVSRQLKDIVADKEAGNDTGME